MPADTFTFPLGPDDTNTLEKLKQTLRNWEANLNREITGFHMLKTAESSGPRANEVDYKFNLKSANLPPIDVVEFPKSGDDAKSLQHYLSTRSYICYCAASIGGAETSILISRPGAQLIWRGKMSTFGGPKDTGMREDEGLAVVDAENFRAYSHLFLGGQMGGSRPLGRNLDPKQNYLACRWNYEVTPREQLLKCRIVVTNPITGQDQEAFAVDWGPSVRTHRIADLSPGLAKSLGLTTNDDCVVTVYLPSGSNADGPPKDSRRKQPIVFSRAQIEQKFGRIDPVREKGDGSFKILNPDFASHVVLADISPLKGIPGVPGKGKVECHELIRDDLQGAIQEIADQGKTNLILRWDGLWVPRHTLWDPRRSYSAHSWGIAFDINARWNGYGSEPAQLGSFGSVRELVPIFEKHGFFWGGHFRTPDGMHFQSG